MAFPHAGVYPPDSWPNQQGTPTPGASIGIYTDQAGTILATLYSSRDRAAGVNPLTLDAYGNMPEFYAEPGEYWAKRLTNGTGVTLSIAVDVDPEDAIDEPSGGGPGAVTSVNGQTGVVVLDATDVGADPSGSASTVNTALTAHLTDTVDAHDASAISNVPAGTIAATDVQGALNELDTDKATTGSVSTVSGNLAAHIADATDAHDASAVSVVPFATIAATDVQAALEEILAEAGGAVSSVNGETGAVILDATDVGADPAGSAATVNTALGNHITDTSDAHDASAISNVPAGGVAATDVQAAINELDTEKASTGSVSTVAGDLAAHIADATDAHAATAITNTPAGGIAATTVQAAINELDTEKAAVASAVMDGDAAGGVLSGTYPNPGFAVDMATQAELDAKVVDAINDGATTTAPSENAVFDALALKAPLASPALTGNPTAPTASPGDNDTSIATTAFVTAADTALIVDSIADSDTTHAPSRNAVFDALALKAPLASPALTGSPTAPTQSAADNSTKIATTAYADAKVADAINDSTTGIAPSQNAVFDALALKAPLTPTVGTGLGTTGSVALDFSTLNGTFQTIALSGNITFTTSNLAAGRSVTLFISAAALRTFTFPAWLFVGQPAPASIAAGKSGVLTLTSTTTADSGVYAAWAVTL